MVIVDTRASGGRGETGIPTDAYFAIEEIREVREAAFLAMDEDGFPPATGAVVIPGEQGTVDRS